MAYSERTRLTGVQTDLYPDAVAYPATNLNAQFDIENSLKVRGAVVTDEGTFRYNIANTSPLVSIGSCTFTNGSNVVTGTGFDTVDLKVGDYVKLDADANSAFAQINSLTPTQITLKTNYTGTGGTGASSRALMGFVTGTGQTLTVASGQATLASGTSINQLINLYRGVDVPPLVARGAFSISQRIANQTIGFGFQDPASVTAPKWFARFLFDGTTNTTVKIQTARNPTTAPSAAETQETTVTLPNGLTTATSNEYRIELMTERVNFFVNNVLVGSHTRTLPGAYDFMDVDMYILNGGSAPASNTNVVVDFISCKNHNKLEVGLLSDVEQVVVSAKPGLIGSGSVAANNADFFVLDCIQLKEILLQVTSVGGGGTISWQASNDPTFAATVSPPAEPSANGPTVTNTTTVGQWKIPVVARYLRVRTTAYTSGTLTVSYIGFENPTPTKQITVVQPTAANLNATVTATNLSTNIAQIGGTGTVNGGVAGTLAVGGNVAHSAASTANPLQAGGRVVPTTIATQDATLVAGDVSYLPITTGLQTITKNFATAELDYSIQFDSAATTVAVQPLVPASGTASVRNYITGFVVSNDALGAAGVAWVLDSALTVSSIATGTGLVTTSTAHDLKVGDAVTFTALAGGTGVSTNVKYHVTSVGSTTTFNFAATVGGSNIVPSVVYTGTTMYRILHQFRFQTTAQQSVNFIIPNPYRGIANTPCNFLIPTTLTSGNIYLTVIGHRGF